MKKRLFGIIMVFCLAFTMMSMTVNADVVSHPPQKANLGFSIIPHKASYDLISPGTAPDGGMYAFDHFYEPLDPTKYTHKDNEGYTFIASNSITPDYHVDGEKSMMITKSLKDLKWYSNKKVYVAVLYLGKEQTIKHNTLELTGRRILKYQLLQTTPGLGKYKVTFKANAKNVTNLSPKSKKVAANRKLGKLPAPKRLGYKLKGWYTKSKGGKRVTKNTVMKGKNLTLYAHWSKKSAVDKSAYIGKNGKVAKCSYLNMRSNAGPSHKIITALKKGTKVHIIKSVKVGKATWYKVKAKGKTGYVYGKYIVKS